MKMLSKAALLATAGSVLVAATPAQARNGNWNNDRIDAGDIIAGALILGGIAAVASSVGNRGYDDRDYGYGDRYRRGGHGWNGGGNSYNSNYGSRYAVDQCVRAAQREASRYGWARVTDVTSIDRDGRGGYEIRGRIVVQDRGYRGNYGGYRGGYDRGHSYDRYNDGYDKGRFNCVTRYDRVVGVRLGGLRNAYGHGY